MKTSALLAALPLSALAAAPPSYTLVDLGTIPLQTFGCQSQAEPGNLPTLGGRVTVICAPNPPFPLTSAAADSGGVGWSFLAGNVYYHAVLTWDGGYGIKDLGVLPGGHYSIAIGWIVGHADVNVSPPPNSNEQSVFHAVTWGDGDPNPIDLGTLGGNPHMLSEAEDSGNVIVGWSQITDMFGELDRRAVIWTLPDHAIYELQTLLGPNTGKVILTEAGHINCFGDIAALGFYGSESALPPDGGYLHSFLLRNVDQSNAAACVAEEQ
jgi:hypothetical protein